MRFFVVLLLFTVSMYAADGPEPDPWWMRVESTQGLLLKWISVLSIVGTALITAIATLWTLLNSKIKDLRERQDRAADDKAVLTASVIDIAKNQQPPAPPPIPPVP